MYSKFIESIITMKQQGEISEAAFVKIRDSYYEEKGYFRKKKTQAIECLASKGSWEEFINQNYGIQKQGVQKQVANQNYSKQFSKANGLYNNEEEKASKERNISTILSTGIILIILAGLILATSTWDLMSNITKTVTLSMISVLFFGMSIFTEKKLKIKRTSFAFWILGNLFLPIILLSIGYFKLFGNYISISGDGKYIFGIMCTLICLPFFAYSIKKYKRRFFVWITLMDISLLGLFLLKEFHFPYNYEILAVIMYTVLITYIYSLFKSRQGTYAFVIRDIKIFSIAMLILNSTKIAGNIIISEVSGIFGSHIATSEGITIVIGLLMLSAIITYWVNELKFNGCILVIGTIIIAMHMLCFTLEIHITQFLYYVLMYMTLVVIYSVFYYWNKFKYIKLMRFGSDITVIILMFVLALSAYINLKLEYTAVLLYILLAVLFFTRKKAIDISYIRFLTTSIPVVLFTANLFSLRAAGLIKNLLNDDKFHPSIILIILNISVIYGISIIFRKLKNDDYKMYYYIGHVFLGILYLYTFECKLDEVLIANVISVVAGISLYFSKAEKKVKFYLYALITGITLMLFNFEAYLKIKEVSLLQVKNLLLCTSLILTIIWYFMDEKWKNRLKTYMIFMYSLGFFSSLFLNEFKNLNASVICILLIAIVLMQVFLCRSNEKRFIGIPLICIWIMDIRITFYLNDVEKLLLNYFVAAALLVSGYVLCRIYKKLTNKEVVYYNGIAGVLLLGTLIVSLRDLPYGYEIGSMIVVGFYLFYLSSFTENINLKKSLIISGLFINYLAYSKFIANFEQIKKLELELILVPSILVLKLINDKYIGKENESAKTISAIWYSIVGVILLIFNPYSNDFHAIIFGSLCILSIIIGFILRNRLHFIGGITFLILGVFLNTLEFWLSVPWWIYLLIGGIILIFFASKNELNKGKASKNENIISKLLKKLKTWK